MKPGEQHILILTYHFPPSTASGSPRLYRFYKYLREFGYRPHVIAAGEGKTDLQDVYYVPNPVRLPKQIAPLALTERLLRRCFFPVDEAMLWGFAARRSAAYLVSRIPFSAVLSTFPPVNSHLAALWLKRRYGLKWIADFRDPVAGNPFRVNGFPAKVDRVMERVFFRQADRLITVTDPIAESWRRRYPGCADKLEVIWNGIDPEEEFPPDTRAPRDYKVLAHVGRLYGSRSPVLILRSIARLLKRGALDPATVRVRLIGSMDDAIDSAEQSLLTTLGEKGCLEWTDDVSRKEAKTAASDADYLLLLDQNAYNLAYAVPAKFFDYVGAARPILLVTQHGSPLDIILPESGIPHLTVYSDDSEERIDMQVLALFALPRGPVSPAAPFLAKFDGRRHAQRLATMLDKLIAD